MAFPTTKDGASSASREAQDFDLIIVGGGAVGCTTALEASRRGLSWALLERAEIGGGASASSLGILHGGFRELRHADLRAHRESARELRWWRNEFPDFTDALRCLVPLDGRGARRRTPMRMALWMHRALERSSGLANDPLGRLSPEETRADAPALGELAARGSAYWTDGRLDDAPGLLREVLARALSLSERSIVREHSAIESAECEAGRVTGLRSRPRHSGTENRQPKERLRAPVIVNAAGAGTEAVARLFGASERIPRCLAWNLLLDRAPLCDGALGVAPPSAGAPLRFLRAKGGRLLAGTGYAPSETVPKGPGGDAADPIPPAAAVQGMLDDLNRALPGLDVASRDVLRTDAGWLPATGPGSADPARRPILIDHGKSGGPKGLITAWTPKLTTARALADRALCHAFGPSAPDRARAHR